MEHIGLQKHDLGDGVVLFTDAVHRFGTDGVLLADFAAPKPRERTLEFGTGCGIVSLIWCRNGKPAHIDAIDIQPDAVDLVHRAILENHFEDRLTVAVQDLCRVTDRFAKGYYDLVVMNPPYKAKGDGAVSPNDGIAAARHEIACDLRQICQSAAQALNTGGRFCLCHRPGRLAEVLTEMHAAGLEPKRLRMVHQRAGSAPNLFLAEGKKDAAQGVIVEPPLILEEENGAMTKAAIAAYGAYYQQKGGEV